METRKKRKISNLLMATLIIVVAGCGVMAVGNIKGWFGGGDSVIACEDITGAVNIERDGVAYSMKAGQGIGSGDILETKTGSEAVLKITKDNTLTMNENTELAITEADGDTVKLELVAGELFADTPDVPKTFEITFGKNKATITGTVFSLSVQTGSSSLNVYEGEVQVTAGDGTEKTISSGKTLSVATVTGGDLDVAVKDLQQTSLSNFLLQKAIGCNSKDKLCFTQSALQKVLDERNAERAQAADGSGDTITADGRSGDAGNSSGSSTGNKNKSDGATDGSKANGDVKTCTIQIRCDTILNNMGNLKAGKERYVPSNGVILATSTVEFTDGETVLDVLKRVCSYTGIPLEYSYTPAYGSSYIEGINHLYEFDCGEQSGWMYKVNGWFPNYGCSSYTLKDGDNIVWCYTCNGLGADVGGSMY